MKPAVLSAVELRLLTRMAHSAQMLLPGEQRRIDNMMRKLLRAQTLMRAARKIG